MKSAERIHIDDALAALREREKTIIDAYTLKCKRESEAYDVSNVMRALVIAYALMILAYVYITSQ